MKLKKRKGLTLIEVILSIMLLSIIAISILPMSIHAVKFAKWNNIRQNAMNMAYQQIEWLKTLDYNTELELKDKNLPPDKFGNVVKGIVEESLYMNEEDSNKKVIDGIEYRFLTNIYWEDGASSTGEYVPNALRKVDVTVIARDPFSGVEKEYSILGTLIAFEGERKIDKTVPFKIKAFTGHDFTELTKSVKIEIYNETGTTLRSWGRTDENGEAIIIGLANGKYRAIGTQWLMGEMMSQPRGVEGIGSNKNWIFYEILELKKPTESDPYINHSIFVDYPAYINLQDINDNILNNNKLILKPKYSSPEGEILNLNLDTNLKRLDNLMIWRVWPYEYTLKHNTTEYKFVEVGTKNLWDGRFEYNKNGKTIKNLTLGYTLGGQDEDDNIYERKDNKIFLHIIYPDTLKVSEENDEIINSLENNGFSLYADDIEVSYELLGIEKSSSSLNKYVIEIRTSNNIDNEKKIQFMLNESLVDINGVDLVSDLRYVMLKQK